VPRRARPVKSRRRHSFYARRPTAVPAGRAGVPPAGDSAARGAL